MQDDAYPAAETASPDDGSSRPADDSPLPQAKSQHALLAPAAGGIALLGGALAALYMGLRRRARKLRDKAAAEPQIAAVGAEHKNAMEALDIGRDAVAAVQGVR